MVFHASDTCILFLVACGTYMVVEPTCCESPTCCERKDAYIGCIEVIIAMGASVT